MQELFPILEQCPLFEGIEKNDLMALMDCLGGRVVETARGQTVMQEGEKATHVGIVLRGSVQLVREDYYGNRSIVAHIGPGGLFGETYACAGVAVLPVNVVTDDPGAVLLLDCHRITVSCTSACGFHSRIIHNLLRLVAVKNLVFDQKIQVTSQRTTREKLMAYLLSQAKILGQSSFYIPYDRQELADYLEVDRSGLSAQISLLRKEGVLESEKNFFRLL